MWHSSELDHHCHIEAVLNSAEVRREPGYKRTWLSLVSSRRRDASAAGEIRNVRRAMIKFPAESDVLTRHVVKSCRSIPGFERITRVLCEIRRTGSCGRSIDGWQEHKVTTGVVDFSASQCQSEQIFVEPQTV